MLNAEFMGYGYLSVCQSLPRRVRSDHNWRFVLQQGSMSTAVWFLRNRLICKVNSGATVADTKTKTKDDYFLECYLRVVW
jgi:hypothetical protein